MKALRFFVWIIVVLIASLTLVVLASPTRYQIAGIKTKVSVSARAGGDSVIAIPPLGNIRAVTHTIPIRLNIDIEGINQSVLSETLNHSKSSTEFFRVVDRDARVSARSFSFKLLLLAAIGGLAGCLFLTRRWLPILGAVLVSLAITGGLLIGVYAQFDPTAFAQPRITGPLASIPFLAASIEKQDNPLDALRDDITLAAKNLRSFSEKIEAWEPVELDKGSIRVLAVSDLHSNPTGFSLLQRVSRDFNVDFIIDAGDITDFGTPLEASQLSQLRNMTLPYFYVPGNHDTSAITRELADLPKIKVLDGRETKEKGVTIYGAGDPVAKITRVKPLSDKEMQRLALKFEQDYDALSPKPDILAVHDRRLAENLIGSVPVIITGHTHKAAVEQEGDTVLINPGSTGASGLSYLTGKKPGAQIYTLSIVYINSRSKRVSAIDTIQVTGLTGEFSLTRQLIQEE